MIELPPLPELIEPELPPLPELPELPLLEPPALILAHDGATELVHGDAIAALNRLEAQSVDLIFADPPYRLSNGGTTCQSGKRASVAKGTWDASSGLAADFAFTKTWLAACQRVLKPSGSIWVSGTQHAIFQIGFAMQELNFHLLNTVTWLKPNASPNLACRFFTHSTEFVIWASPSRKQPLAHTFNYHDMKRENGGKQMRDVWEIQPDGEGELWTIPTPAKSEKTEGRHPTQKPLALLQRIIAASSKPGDLIVDPFCGSGTTGVAAVLLDRRFIGIDTDGDYLALAKRRIHKALTGA